MANKEPGLKGMLLEYQVYVGFVLVALPFVVLPFFDYFNVIGNIINFIGPNTRRSGGANLPLSIVMTILLAIGPFLILAGRLDDLRPLRMIVCGLVALLFGLVLFGGLVLFSFQLYYQF